MTDDGAHACSPLDFVQVVSNFRELLCIHAVLSGNSETGRRSVSEEWLPAAPLIYAHFGHG